MIIRAKGIFLNPARQREDKKLKNQSFRKKKLY